MIILDVPIWYVQSDGVAIDASLVAILANVLIYKWYIG